MDADMAGKDAVYIEVKDDGVGIDPEDQKRIFERFSEWTRAEAGRWEEPVWAFLS